MSAARGGVKGYELLARAFVAEGVDHLFALMGDANMQAQSSSWSAEYSSSGVLLPTPQRMHPDPLVVERIVDMFAAAQRPIIIGGRGATRSGAGAALEVLAERTGAPLGTSLLAKGLFDHHPYALGIAGAFANDVARELYAQADLVLGVGAGLSRHTGPAGPARDHPGTRSRGAP